jgi:hypothetical protein
MKPQIAIILITLVFLGAFAAYKHAPSRVSNLADSNTGADLQANVDKAVEVAVTPPLEESGNQPSQPRIDVKSADGLDEELRGIIEGFSILDEELQSLEGTSTPAAQ